MSLFGVPGSFPPLSWGPLPIDRQGDIAPKIRKGTDGPSGTSRSLTVVDHDEPVFIIFLTATGSPSTTV